VPHPSSQELEDQDRMVIFPGYSPRYLQCFDAVGWVTGRVFGL